jgi:hypothetical protein
LRVKIQDGWVEDLVKLFNDATVVIYDSADYWRGRGVSEGFGMPPLEALASGAVVFSSFNHALADYLDPSLSLGHQIGFGTMECDLKRITAAVANPGSWRPHPRDLELLLHQHEAAQQLERWRRALLEVNDHWNHVSAGADPLQSPSQASLRLGGCSAAVLKVMKRVPLGSWANRLADWLRSRFHQGSGL